LILFVEKFSRNPRQGRFVPHIRFRFLSRATILLIVAFFIFTVDLSAQKAPPAVPPAPPTREVVDEAGRTVRIPVSPSRIVSLAPSLTETVYALGLQDRLVGDTDFCDYPADAQKKTKVGGGVNPNLEIIVSLRPDLVLVTNSFNRLDTVRALENLGIPSYDLDPHTVDEIVSSTEKLADILGAPDAGKSMATDLQNRLATLHAKLSTVPEIRVLFVVWTEPLMSIGKSTFVADALHRAGANSIVDSSKDWPQMSLEEVVKLQPDFLVFPQTHSDGGVHDFESLATKPGWRLLDAVQNRRLAVVSDAIIRPAPRIVSVIEDLARQLHPAVFQEPTSPEKTPVSQNPPNPEHTDLRAQTNSLIDVAFSLVAACAR
jgi:iron complex transport system substrate-binding protein